MTERSLEDVGGATARMGAWSEYASLLGLPLRAWWWWSSRRWCGGSSYLKDVVWWIGTLSSEYSALRRHSLDMQLQKVIRAVLAWWLLQERLELLGQLGCVLCCCGRGSDHPRPPRPSPSPPETQLEERLLDQVWCCPFK
ncbi:Magnesium transporter NIPA1 [Merluccius polli]|uniref:Magnesium transporter NIPA1 n=1 Tax=Merluccius polli TaxID=89951 RepID=A0AA47N301_MERPO|nr:Magnesium transporter NIPA1 [Merluccius polli]